MIPIPSETDDSRAGAPVLRPVALNSDVLASIMDSIVQSIGIASPTNPLDRIGWNLIPLIQSG